MSNDTTDDCITWAQLLDEVQPIRPDAANSVTDTYQALLVGQKQKVASAAVDAPCESVSNMSGCVQIRRLNELIKRERYDSPPEPVSYGREYDKRNFSLASEEQKAVAGILNVTLYLECQDDWDDWMLQHILMHPNCAPELIRVTRNFGRGARLNCFGGALVENPRELISNPWTVDLSTVFGDKSIEQWLNEQSKKHPWNGVRSRECELEDLILKRAFEALGAEGFEKKYGYPFLAFFSGD